MFGKEFLENSMLCFTKFRNDKRSKKERASKKKPSEKKLKDEYKELFEEHYKYKLTED